MNTLIHFLDTPKRFEISALLKPCPLVRQPVTREGGDFFQSGVTRDGATPRDNFVCVHCQREAAEGRSLNGAVDRYEQRRSLTRLARPKLAFHRGIGHEISHDSVLHGRQLRKQAY